MNEYKDSIFQASLLKAQQEASIDGILVVSPSGQIISYNQRFLDLWGISPNTILSESDDALLRSVTAKLANAESFLGRINYLYAHPLEKSIEEVNLIDERTFERNSAPVVDSNNQVLGRVWFFRDITQKKISERKIIDQQIATANAGKLSAIGQMSAEIFHEIATPLALITLVNDKLRTVALQNTIEFESLMKDTETIEKSVDRITKIIKSLKVLTHDASKLEFQLSTIQSIINNTLEFCQSKIRISGTKIMVSEIPAELNLICNPVLITQVLLNLINNSIQATETLSEKWIKIIVTQNEALFKIEIVDSGNGIPPEVQEKMFSSFFTTKPIGVGTGLGLNISRSIIQAHGGTLEIDNKNKNTSFVISIPRKRPHEITVEKHDVKSSPRSVR
ncbi:MAG: ATP-binding protein [Pseudobdellovibrio sp.]